MSNRRSPRQEKIKMQDNAARTFDSFQNFIAAVGRGTGNQNDGGHYGFNPVSRNRIQMEYVYRGSWVAGRVVDCIAKDMTREGVEITTDDPPDKIADFEKEIARLQTWKKLCQTVQWARLYGGALAFMMIDGQDPSTPLRLDTIQKGQFKGLLPLDRWMVQPSLQSLVEDYGNSFGLPLFYDTVPDTGGMPRLKIHYSRVIRIEGAELPYWQKIAENLWGQSELERMWDRLIMYDSATTGVAQLVYKAHLRTLSIPGLREIIGGNKAALQGLVANVAMIKAMQTNEGLTLIDEKDTFETTSYNFGGLDTVLMQFGEQISGATEIPLVRLFGQSPTGFSSGDTDLRMYYDSIKQRQVNTLGDGIETLYRLIYISKFGVEPPKVFELDFRPLWQMSDVEKSQVTNTTTAAIMEALEGQAISRSTAMKELKALSRSTGVFSNISDEEIKSAEADPAPTPEALGLAIPAKPDVPKSGSGAGGANSRPSRGSSSGGTKEPSKDSAGGAELRIVA